jgi:hypothetical protein
MNECRWTGNRLLQLGLPSALVIIIILVLNHPVTCWWCWSPLQHHQVEQQRVSHADLVLSTAVKFEPVIALVPNRTFFATSRRRCLASVASGLLTISTTKIDSSHAQNKISYEISANELPSFLRDYTKLAPLGQKQVFVNKTMGLSLTELAQRLTHDLLEGATGQGGYFLTGDLSTDVFQDDCVFVDPTNRVTSLSQYQKALTVLFDPNRSSIELVRPLVVNEMDGTITGRLRSGGYLQLPWKPYISSYETTIQYTVNRTTGLIARQDQTWDKSAWQALQETFTPSLIDLSRPTAPNQTVHLQQTLRTSPAKSIPTRTG